MPTGRPALDDFFAPPMENPQSKTLGELDLPASIVCNHARRGVLPRIVDFDRPFFPIDGLTCSMQQQLVSVSRVVEVIIARLEVLDFWLQTGQRPRIPRRKTNEPSEGDLDPQCIGRRS